VKGADPWFLAADRPQPDEPAPSLRVLHIVEALGSGIATALEDYIRSTPGHAHTVLGYRRPGAQTGDGLERLAALLLLPEGRLAQIRAVRRWVRELRPDVIHAHSTYAGLYVRLFVRASAASVVFTPHAYPFERRDIPAALRGVYWLIEALLSLRGGCVAAVGRHEAMLAERLPGKQVVVHLPNVVRSVRSTPPASIQDRSAEGGLRLAMVGRISPQKGPDFFRRAVELSQASALPLRWIWIGGGEAADERALREAGAEVTGWVSRSEALGWLATADVYVHTAAWEGLPVSLLEAAALGLPIVARRIPALEHLGLPLLCDSPEALVAALRPLLDERRRDALRTRSWLLAEHHQPAAQRKALELAYSLGSDPGGRTTRESVR
jgi:glycosyltransferase involved in cell wall biosynthesis